jgi:nitrate/TMAO reductase-like tetraheme cytochrome c subunit
MKSLLKRIQNFFYPAPGSRPLMYILPLLVIGLVGLSALAVGNYGWEYSNSPEFCGSSCHTMPPQNAAYIRSPHANVTCEECHIGRASLGNQLVRKSQGFKELYYQTFKLYEYPIRASALQPARVTCEKCHQPETFSDDSLRSFTHFGTDFANTPETIYLILKTGGGAKREGLGRGIHWHIVNKVEYLATDKLDQQIPFVRVTNEDGTTTDYVDIEADFDAASVDSSQLKEMDCTTCHNRITHEFRFPTESVEEAMARGVIDPGIPGIRKKAVDVLSAPYESREQAMQAIAELEADYKASEYFPGHGEAITRAMEKIREIYDTTRFHDQEIDWETYPNNIGHINSPGCFRCHDGKHLNAENEAVRLECNVCHSIPNVAGSEDFVTNIQISRGLEPESHRNPNWISLHNQVMDATCTNCHTTDDPGGTSNTSFCSNSACHGSTYTYAGFDAPALREVLAEQLPVPAPAPALEPVAGTPTFDSYAGPLFSAKCTMCHGTTASAGLDLSTYASTMQGGTGGPVIVPGDSAASKLIQVQSQPHFANLSAEELEFIKQWIDAGAPEK